MRTITITILSLLFATSSAHAFLSRSEEKVLLESMNQNKPAEVNFESIRCSLRNRFCLVRFTAGNQNKGCMIERINDSSELYHSDVDQDGKTQLSLSSYAEKTLAQCL